MSNVHYDGKELLKTMYYNYNGKFFISSPANLCFAILSANAVVVNEGFTPNEVGIIAPSLHIILHRVSC